MSKIIKILIERREKEIFVDLSREGDDKLTKSKKQKSKWKRKNMEKAKKNKTNKNY